MLRLHVLQTSGDSIATYHTYSNVRINHAFFLSAAWGRDSLKASSCLRGVSSGGEWPNRRRPCLQSLAFTQTNPETRDILFNFSVQWGSYATVSSI